MKTKELSSKGLSVEEIIETLKNPNSNELINADEKYCFFDIGNNLNYAILKSYYYYLNKFREENNIPVLFWHNGSKNIKTCDRIYDFSKLRFIETIDEFPFEIGLNFWENLFKNPNVLFTKEYDNAPDSPSITWQTDSMSGALQQLMENKHLPEHFNLWAINNHPLFPCTNGEVRLMSDTILPSPEWGLIAPYLPVLAVEVNSSELSKVKYQGKQVFRFKERPTNEDLKIAQNKLIAKSNIDLELKTKLITHLMV